MQSCQSHVGLKRALQRVLNQKGNVPKVPGQKTTPVVIENDAVNTSDEEHEELPYDGAHSNYKTKMNLKASSGEMATEMPAEHFSTLDKLSMQIGTTEQTEDCQSNLTHCLLSNQKAIKNVAPPVATPIQPADHISDFLLRHFSKEELLNSSRIIDAETLPEMSLMDSIDETVHSQAPQIFIGESEKIQDVIEELGQSHGLAELNVSNESSSSKEPESTCISDAASAGDDDDNKECPKQNRSANSLDLSEADVQKPKCSFGRTRSYSELKYGQGKVHYPLPDFSKVAPKVKIPKGNGGFKPISPSPAMVRAQSSPGILAKTASSCKPTADIISRVLEDSIMPPENVFADKEVAHQLQVEYDRLLAKYTESENLIGQQFHASSEPSVTIDWNDATSNNENTKLTATNPQAPAAGPSEKQFSLQNSQPVETESQSLTDGERLTSELRDIIRSFMEKVDEFKTCVSAMSMNKEEQQMVLKSMMEAQDQLERNYLTKREEHRALEMQNYRGLTRNTGEFDPDREVEGQIFRIGMHLEDIKEQIDRNVCHVFYPPSYSTPSPPPCEDIRVSSPHPSLHEESVFSISPVRHNTEDNDDEETTEDHTADGLFPSRTENSFYLQYSTFSTETAGTANVEQENRLTTGEDQHYEDVLAQASSSTLLKQLTHDRHEEKIRHREAASTSVEPSPWNSPQTATEKTQSFFSPETDSAFGSFDLSRPSTGLSQTPSGAVSSALSDNVISIANTSGSDSEASRSNVRTTISVAPRPVQPAVNHLEYGQIVTQIMEVRAPKEDDTSVGATHNQATERIRDDPLGKSRSAHEMHTASHCSCHNSEVILELQYEVSRLKRALEESLGHLPHDSKKTDYLNGRYPLERKHKGQTRSQNRGSSSRRVKPDSNLQTIEDWISSDMELSKSKVTEGEDSDRTISLQRAFSPSHGLICTRFSADKGSHDSRTSSKTSVESFPMDTSQFILSGSRRKASIGPANHSTDTEPTNKSASYRPATGNFLNSTKLAPSIPVHPSHKPLLQVNYGSSCSLPAGFKVRDQTSEPVSTKRRSTQSDSALLPSNVFFQRTSPRTSGRRHRTSREESIHKTLDKALQAAFLMKQTTDRMADALSADLAKAQLQRKLLGLNPLSSRAGS
ncbi:microtubule organization protein AKNA-like [Puntigrus tetrazona]|uniref:microtubule organization protein AKNA-like n=1 Tax=Puntigrus tetrazona TaxID=1606681 RepID=UPI001C88FED5|nr:microtubule organization protein AKNA-like [Puntigrus tetrazona]